MGTIKLLSPDVCNQIAAGEVVERPASVVKELVENSLDAGATQIDVRLDNGGQTLIRVQDNGFGIPESELELALTRHATSKIATADDLDHILTYGFRGEALPSIASVSRFKITSVYPPDGLEAGIGSSLSVEYGTVRGSRKAALRRGTVIEVRDLFSNLPGRLKFLKQPATEFRKAQNWLVRLAIAQPDIGFSLFAGERQVMRFNQAQNLKDRMRVVWPAEIADELIPLHTTLHGITITGLAAPPHLHQPRADRIFFYVNGRAVNDKRLLTAVREAYKGRQISRDYPQLVLFVEVNPGEVDVNAHPAKTEVRFQNESAIFSAVLSALGEAFQEKPGHSPELGGDYLRQPPGFWGSIDRPRVMEFRSPAKEKGNWEAVYAPASDTPLQTGLEEAPPAKPYLVELPAEAPKRPRYEYLGQLADTYLILKEGPTLVLLDQHAAHERILFHRFGQGNTGGLGQKLIVPLDVPLEPGCSEYFEQIAPTLESLGFHFKQVGAILRFDAISPLITRAEAREFVAELLSGRKRDAGVLWIGLACHAAIKAGQKLSEDEALELIAQWQSTPESDFCPHGRPCVLRWDSQALERLFKRR